MKFIHFGCWNKDLCVFLNKVNNEYNHLVQTEISAENARTINKKHSNMSYVLQSLRNNINKNQEKSIKFIIIAGDNYYPDKVKIKKGTKSNNNLKLKSIIVKNLLSGFDCLPKNIETFILLGNHDIENINSSNIKTKYSKIPEITEHQNVIYNNYKSYLNPNNSNLNELIRSSTNNNIKECLIYKIQKFYANFQKNLNLIYNNVGFRIINSTLVIMIDTNLYDMNEGSKELICYNQIYSNNVNLSNLIDIQNTQVFEIIQSELKDNIKNVVLTGHHPIISSKIKKDKFKTIPINNIELFIELFRIIPNEINKYYLCADTHLYQEGIIEFEDQIINQYICGTGGAEKNNTIPIPINGKSYQINNIKGLDFNYLIKISQKENGYLEVDCENDDLKFSFKKITI